MSTPKATHSQITFIQDLQRQKGFPVSKTSRLEVMHRETASGWIGALLRDVDPTKTSPKRKLGATSTNPYVRSEQAQQGAQAHRINTAESQFSKRTEPSVEIPYEDRIAELQSVKLKAALRHILTAQAYGVDALADMGFDILHRLEAGQQ
jgi:hypothetical protein